MCPLRGEDPASYQNTAATALKFEMAQIGRDCGSANTTLEINGCLSRVEETSQRNFRAFYDSLRKLLNRAAGAAQQLDSSQANWEKYSTSACDAVYAFYRDGSIRNAKAIGCRIQLTRSRMQDLNALYDTVLHL
ncbi:MAG: DUF1311 domain-containing protein [Acidobacteriaceae bacterium]|nr:DUF1311 domain-containing protein [Acidobacteriaceae bacterium]